MGCEALDDRRDVRVGCEVVQDLEATLRNAIEIGTVAGGEVVQMNQNASLRVVACSEGDVEWCSGGILDFEASGRPEVDGRGMAVVVGPNNRDDLTNASGVETDFALGDACSEVLRGDDGDADRLRGGARDIV
jgi:hypothetical protein